MFYILILNYVLHLYANWWISGRFIYLVIFQSLQNLNNGFKKRGVSQFAFRKKYIKNVFNYSGLSVLYEIN